MNPTQAMNKILKNEKEITELKRFIELVDEYQPGTFEHRVIHEYAKTGSLLDTLGFIHRSGYKLPNGKQYTQADVSAIIRSKPQDELHKIVQKYLKSKDMSKRRS